MVLDLGALKECIEGYLCLASLLAKVADGNDRLIVDLADGVVVAKGNLEVVEALLATGMVELPVPLERR